MLPDLVFQGCNYLRTISLPQSLKTIGEYSFSDCVALRFVILPSSVSLLGDYAFYNCIDLRYVLVSNPDCLIGKEAFSNTPKMLLYSDINSLATVFAIENNVPYIASDVANLDHSGLLDRTSSNYFADTNSVNTNGHVAFTIDCEVPVNEWEATTQRSILIKVPSNTNPIESTLKINGEICTEYEYDEDEELITIAATEASTTIKYTSKIYSSDDLVSYALISYSKDGEQKQEVIGVIDEKYDAFTVNAVELTSQREISIDGAAPAGSKISIYVDNVLAATCNATKAGIYFSHVTLQGTSSEQVYVISAKCEQTSGKTLNATTFVSFRQEAPTLTGFKFYINDDSAQMVDLYSYALHGIYPSITHTGSQYPYRFEVTFTNPEMIDAVFVTSTRNNIKKSIPAVYDERTQTFIATGHFDEENKLYVPGSLGVEYNLKHEDALIGTDIDWDMLKQHLSQALIDRAKVDNTASATGAYGTIDLSEVTEDLRDVVLDFYVGMYDAETGGSLEDLFSMGGVVDKIFAYIIPGLEGEKYYAVLDLRNPEIISMIVADAAEVSDTAVQLYLSAHENNGTYLPASFYDIADSLSNFSTAASVLYETYGIYDDYDELCDEIMQSSSIKDKSEALLKAEELRTDQMAFMLMTTMLPLLITGGSMAAPAVLFTAALGMMKATSDIFWQLRVTQIKGESYKIKWHIDPSGYVYDIDTGARLQGVTTTAYYIPYDDSNDFWDNVPDQTVIGVLWDASEYNQENPLITDAEGRYAWDVPEGWWRVKYEKEGYETVWSEWLPVPPPQTEVNIGIKALDSSACEFNLMDHTATFGKISASNNSGSSVNGNFVVAAYNSEGKLVDIQMVQDSLAADETLVMVLSCSSDETIEVIKGFILDIATHKPIYKHWEVDIYS